MYSEQEIREMIRDIIKEELQNAKDETEQDKKDSDLHIKQVVFKEYIDDVNNKPHWYLDGDCMIESFDSGEKLYMNEPNPFVNYLSEEYAETAKSMKTMNDILLAFKWCYDRTYIPDWSTEQAKYFVAYDHTSHRYRTGTYYSWSLPIVYFSSREIAQKCADILNQLHDI